MLLPPEKNGRAMNGTRPVQRSKMLLAGSRLGELLGLPSSGRDPQGERSVGEGDRRRVHFGIDCRTDMGVSVEMLDKQNLRIGGVNSHKSAKNNDLEPKKFD